MALNREQHNRIMRVYQERRFQHLQERRQRAEEISLKLPSYDRLSEEAAQLRTEQAKSLLSHDGSRAEALAERIAGIEAEKKALLLQNGYPEDYLELQYTCPLCRDTGYVNNEKCGCQKKLISELIYRQKAGLPEALWEDSFQTYDFSLFDDTDPIPELLRQTGKRVTQRAYMQTVVPLLKKYAEEFPQKGGSLLLTGQTGTGKTFLSNCIAKEVIDRCQQVLYVRAGDFFDAMARESFERREGQEALQTDAAATCDLLIIDDLGTERRTEFTLSRLFSLVSDRLARKKGTIISTNLDGNNIKHLYGERMTSRLAQYTVIPFYGKDLRLRGGN